jgi:NhaA family Na+:H+ antiporter
MAVFFLLVGLEIKRELMAGELATPARAALPVAAALGGMAVPAAVYLLVIGGGPLSRGWAIAMATDIAFAISVFQVALPRAPLSLKVFLTALAIVDDMGAVAVIAALYTSNVAWLPLLWSGVLVAALVTFNATGVRRLLPYMMLGPVLWLFVHASGVHATMAGLLLAFTIPTRTRINTGEFADASRRLLDQFERTETGDLMVLTSKGQQDAIVGLERASEAVTAPLLRLEHSLQGFSALVAMPLFAFANAGVPFSATAFDRLTLAVACGLVLGKPVGIAGATAVAHRLGLASLPDGVEWSALRGCAWLGGIGFTMSLFIATLAFEGMPELESAKMGIFLGSIVSGVIGSVLLRRSERSSRTRIAA